ncbi:MAG: ABC-2 family transporter protein [Planctomycetes bacterium]|nr:ABC-2 family transporter protein [Planctomycetota bacterium]
MRRYVALLLAQFRVSAAAAMAYRANFVLEGLLSLVWIGLALLPLLVLFEQRESVNGWDASASLVVIGYFTSLRALLEGVVNPSLNDLIARIRTGELDYVLLKPVDAQIAVSASHYAPWKVVDLLGGIAIIVWALVRRGEMPTAGQLALGVMLFGAGAIAMYSLWIACAALSFRLVRLDNLMFLLSAVFDTARWPVHVFPGLWRVLFTFVVPIALITTFPAMGLLGTLTPLGALGTVGGSLVMLVLSRLAWRAAIRGYTSASS